MAFDSGVFVYAAARTAKGLDMSALGKAVATMGLLAVGLVLLAFTGCGLFFGFSLLFNGGWQLSLLGFVFAVLGIAGLLPIYRGLRDLFFPRSTSAPPPSVDSVDEHPDSQ